MGFGVSITGDPELAAALKLTGTKLLHAVSDAVSETALMVETDAKKNIRANGSTDTGVTASNIGVERIDSTNSDVIAHGPGSASLEFGAVPHWVPIGPLKDWARRKLKDESAAYAVQRKIAESGTRPQPYLMPAREEGAAKMRETIIKHARKVTGS